MRSPAAWLLALAVACAAGAVGAGHPGGSNVLVRLVDAAKLQTLYSQKMTVEFLLIASGVDAAANRLRLQSSVSAFDGMLADLINESAQSAPPHLALRPEMEVLDQNWTALKLAFEGGYLSSIGVVEALSDALAERLDLIVRRMSGFIQAGGGRRQSQAMDMAEEQRIRTQEMQKEAILVHLGIQPSDNLLKLRREMELFTATHLGILRGVELLGLEGVRSMCTLHAMANVSREWDMVKMTLQEVVDQQELVQRRLLLAAMGSGSQGLDAALELAEGLLHFDAATCHPVIPESGWMRAVQEVSRHRKLGQRAARLVFQMSRGAVPLADGKVALAGILTDASASLRLCIEGSHTLNVPPPPTQEITDRLLEAWQEWKAFEQDCLVMVESGFAKARGLAVLANLSIAVFDSVGTAAELYLIEGNSRRVVTCFLANRQLAVLEKMAKEAVLGSAGDPLAPAHFYSTAQIFEASHWDLLLGGSVTLGAQASRPGHEQMLVRTTDHCSLNLMSDALRSFHSLRDALVPLANGTKLSANEKLEVVRSLDGLVSAAEEAAQPAVDSYAMVSEATYECQIHYTAADWITNIAHSGQSACLFHTALKDFYLLASGLDSEWARQAANLLEAHQRYITVDVLDPRLVDAAKDFRAAWNSYRGTEEERRMALQAAYIRDNPHPLGAKDALDYAPGPEEYHKVHGMYHPIYRAMLYERNYYDIFIFDLSGNLIYSVFKELDYATNFAANGGGEWADSGLGDAFRAAVKSPDAVSVIPWRPYGPSHGALASFISTGIRGVAGNLIGVFCTQMPPESKPMDSRESMETAAGKVDSIVSGLKFSDLSSGLRSPPTQDVADALFRAGDRWTAVKPLLLANARSASNQQRADLVAEGSLFLADLHHLADALVQGAWMANRQVEGTKIALANGQCSLIEQMNQAAILIYMNGLDTTRQELMASLDHFKAIQDLLLQGNNTGVIQVKTTVTKTTDPLLTHQMESVDAAFLSWRPSLVRAANSNADYGEAQVRDVVDASEAVSSSMQAAAAVYSATHTTTIMSIDILAPMPITGEWSGGRTMRVAALLAQDLINTEQQILPGYKLNTMIFDDRCDAEVAMELVLGQLNQERASYVAYGGAGCSKVCEGTAFLASSMRLPFLSYECAAETLSDTRRFPDFARFGTVVRVGSAAVFTALGKRFDWRRIVVVSGDPSKYSSTAEDIRDSLVNKGFQSNYVYSYEEWDQILTTMEALRTARERVLLVVGTETFFRKLICASIIVGANKGITWLSEGTWRHEWWKKSDAVVESHRQWIRSDALQPGMIEAIVDFKLAWDQLAGSDHARQVLLQAAYITNNPFPTGSKESLDAAPGPEDYHKAHQRYHPEYRDRLRDRNYYDIFFFDLEGNLIYSVFKELDFATNFRAEGGGEWKDSGLGDAFRAAMAHPDIVSEIPWRPYGPSYGAQASFLSTGVRGKSGEMLGVLATQLPPEAKSIDTVEPKCSLHAIMQAYEGAINVVGYGQPEESEMDKPLPCFQGHSARSFLELVDKHLAEGYPLGDNRTQVPDPFGSIKAHAADATCVFAYTVKYLLGQGYSLKDIQRPNQEVYQKFVDYMKKQTNFDGVSGRVRFDGNDKSGSLAVHQVRDGSKMLVGIRFINGSVDLSYNGGPTNVSWQPAHPPPPPLVETFPFWIIYLIVPLVICTPVCWVCKKECHGHNAASNRGERER